MKILFLLPYPLKQAPSQRFRVEQYLDILTANGHTLEIQSFLEAPQGAALFDQKATLSKILAVIRGFIRRAGMLFRVHQFDFIFIHREAAPIGPPWLEWIIARVLDKRIIYDYDDAIWMTDAVSEGLLKKILKWRSKVKSICAWSHTVSCGNAWLSEFARQVNSSVVLNPTTIDTIAQHRRSLYPAPVQKTIVTIGWTGSYTTLKYLQPLERILQLLEKKYQGLDFMVIADQPPALKIPRLSFRPWSAQTEVEDLLLVDIGVMPLPDDEWSKGKCGFKALQYMALEIPVVLSPVGANPEIITEGTDGFFASTEAEWIHRLAMLIENRELRERMGKEGRRTVEDHYSVVSNTSLFLGLFE